MGQLSFDDAIRIDQLSREPNRIAYIDESGNFGFDFDKQGTSKFFILCAVIVKDTDIPRITNEIEIVKHNNGIQNNELKSSSIGGKDGRRRKILAELLQIDFQVMLLIVNKQELFKDSPLTTYKDSFLKNIHQQLYSLMYQAYPKLKIIEDQTGRTEFQISFRKYVENHRPTLNLFNEYDFDFIDSKDSILIQLADFIAGSISRTLNGTETYNYIQLLKGKIMRLENFPKINEPFYTPSSDQVDFDKSIFGLSLHTANNFIEEFQNDKSQEKQLQREVLKILIFYVLNINSTKFVSSAQLIKNLENYPGKRITNNYLYRRIIAPLRDSGVILASSPDGYKIPVSKRDIQTYLLQTHNVVSPMLHRIELCRNLVKLKTDNKLDVLDHPDFVRYKKYFD